MRQEVTTRGAEALAAVDGEVHRFAAELRHRTGHASFEPRVLRDPRTRVVTLRGTAPSPAVRRRAIDALRAAAPRDWRVVDHLDVLRTGEWRTPPPGRTDLWAAAPGGRDARVRATQVHHRDGPLEVLVEEERSSLVRTAEGTLGWVHRPLGVPTAGPRSARPARTADLEHATSWVGVPYLLGGSLTSGIDCSALVMRVFGAAWRVRLPRHSTDQAPVPLRGRSRAEAGDVAVVDVPGAGAHVGVVVATPADGPLVLHASSTRRRVVVEPLRRFAAGHAARFVSAEALIESHGATWTS